MKPVTTLTLVVLIVLALGVGLAFADLISVPLSSFGSETLVERFSEPIDTTNATVNSNSMNFWSMVVIGTNRPYIFTNTGVTFVSPVPNVEGDWLPIISLIKGNQNFGFGTTTGYGELLEGSGLIPGGVGARALVQTGSSSVHFDPFFLTFPGNGASQVGLYPIMAGGGVVEWRQPWLDRIVITAYDADGAYLGRMDCVPQHVSQWANNFWGFKSSDGTPIAKIGIDYSDNYGASRPGIANLMFVPYVVPEPTPLAMMAILLVLVAGWQIFLKE